MNQKLRQMGDQRHLAAVAATFYYLDHDGNGDQSLRFVAGLRRIVVELGVVSVKLDLRKALIELELELEFELN